MKKKRRLRKIYLIICCAIAAGFLIFCYSKMIPAVKTIGKEYLQEQEKKDVSDIETKIREARDAAFAASINNGEQTIFAGLEDAVLYGDSRIYGFYNFGLVPSDKVYAYPGNTILNIDDYLDLFEAAQPSDVYIACGINDMGLELDKSHPEGYAGLVKEQVSKITAVCPNISIHINSVLDATPQRLELSPRWGKVNEFNQQIQKACSEMGWDYIDNSKLTDGGNAPIYSDGVHFFPSFYPVWTANMLRNKYPGIQDPLPHQELYSNLSY